MSVASEITRINNNIASAYTAVSNKGGTLPQTQNSANLATAIDSITTGGGFVSVQEKDINFYDYDGTRLHSYTLAEVQELTELPELPMQQGLTCQGWNWTLADLKAEGKPTDVGATYITDDGKTRLYIHIATNARMNVPLCFRQSITNGVEVDWGDGSTAETFSGSGSTGIFPMHQYNSIGNYIITLNPIEGCILTLGNNSSSYCIMGDNTENNKVYQNMLNKVEIGNRVSAITTSAFAYCCSLVNITIPNSITNIGNNAFANCYSLNDIVLPIGISNIYSYTFANCYALRNIILPVTINAINSYAASYCQSLSKIKMSNDITVINTSTFYSCFSLSKVIMPNSLTSIKSNAFYNCYGMAIYDFSNISAVPALSSINAFNNIQSDCKIIVPDSLYNDWIAASNWSTYVDYIVKASEV